MSLFYSTYKLAFIRVLSKEWSDFSLAGFIHQCESKVKNQCSYYGTTSDAWLKLGGWQTELYIPPPLLPTDFVSVGRDRKRLRAVASAHSTAKSALAEETRINDSIPLPAGLYCSVVK